MTKSPLIVPKVNIITNFKQALAVHADVICVVHTPSPPMWLKLTRSLDQGLSGSSNAFLGGLKGGYW